MAFAPQSGHRDDDGKLILKSATKNGWISHQREPGNVVMLFSNNLVQLSPREMTLKIVIYAWCSMAPRRFLPPRWHSMVGTDVAVLAAGSWRSSYCRCRCSSRNQFHSACEQGYIYCKTIAYMHMLEPTLLKYTSYGMHGMRQTEAK